MIIQPELLTAIQAARTAGELLKRNFRHDIAVEYKGEINPVTPLDLEAEKLISDILGNAFPSYGILGEENQYQYQSDNPFWIVDPLDGTTNYIRGYPLFSVSIALQRDRHTMLGVVFSPLFDELFVAVKGEGAFLNWQPIQVSKTQKLGQAVLASGFPYDIRGTDRDNLKQWARLTKQIFSPRCDGCASLDLCFVACGRYDGYWELDLEAWDMAAGALIVTEAGGIVTDVNGAALNLFGRSIVSGNPDIHGQLLECLEAREE